MNAQWSEMNKKMQTQLRSKAHFEEGIETLLCLRTELMQAVDQFHQTLPSAAFSFAPYLNARGYHSKTIAYSLWHIARIEDIVVHTLIMKDEQVIFQNDFLKHMHPSLITTGNELQGEDIIIFSKGLDVEALYAYIHAVRTQTDVILKQMTAQDGRRAIGLAEREALISQHVVSTQETASWLVDYRCGKTVRGLLQMPLSRHWVMHIEACTRIAARLSTQLAKESC